MADRLASAESLQECQRGHSKDLAAPIPRTLWPPSLCGGALPLVPELREECPCRSAGYNVPARFRGGAASCQGQMGEESEQRGYPLYGQGLRWVGAELPGHSLQGTHQHWVQLPEGGQCTKGDGDIMPAPEICSLIKGIRRGGARAWYSWRVSRGKAGWE